MDRFESQSTLPLESIRLHKSEGSLSEAGGPPPLGYDIASKKRSIIISASSIIVINGILPAALFYILEYGSSLSKSNVINIVEITTTFTLVQWPWRLWQLLRRGGERAPRDRTALTLDNYQWNFLIGIFPVTFCCVMAGIKESIRWYMFGPVTLFAQIAAQAVLTWFLTRAKVTIPVRMSSVPAGAPTRPAAYFLTEDITACDGGGGQGFRERVNMRYECSPPFRKLLQDLTLVIGLGFLAQTAAQVVILFATDEKVFVAVSTVVLWGWCCISAWWAISFTKRALEDEKLWWAEGFRKSQEVA